MRAISLWQPWASLLFASHPVLGRFKVHETRHWGTDYRGHLAIHAAQKIVKELPDDFDRLVRETFGSDWAKVLPRGRIVGVVMVTACRSTESISPDTLDRLAGDWTPGRFAWRTENPVAFPTPPEVKGRQGFFQWEPPWGPRLL